MRLIWTTVTAAAVVAVGLAHSPLAQAANSATAARFTATVNEMVAKYHLAPITVATDMTMDAPYRVAQTKSSSVIELSTEYGSMTPDQFGAAMAHNIGGYHPGGCNAVRMIAIHEVGHIINNRKNGAPRSSAAAAIGRGTISRDLHGAAFNDDGSINASEALAVSFSAVECGSATATERTLYHTLVG